LPCASLYPLKITLLHRSMYQKIVLLGLSALLAACGGGGGGDTTSVNPVAPVTPPTVTVGIPAATYPAGSAELGGWTTLQQARVLCGFGALKQNAQLDAAATNHARYLTSISVASGTSVLSHFESDTSNPYYRGYEPWDRTLVAGYGSQVAEILEATVWNYDISNPPVFPTLQERGTASMQSLLNTVYHLIGAMYDGADVGFGADMQTAVNGSVRQEEYRFGSLNGFQTHTLSLGAGQLATYPCQDSSGIPPSFVPANETPNPFPALTSSSQTVGPPIYLKVDAGQVLTLTSSSVSTGGFSVPTQTLTWANDPHRELGANEVFVVPSSSLQANTAYQVTLNGRIDGRPFSRNFTMTTGR